MLAIAFRFPAGRYHATPWGRHVNEAEVEWPPSPWRILRALVATYHRKGWADRHPEPALDGLLEALSETLPSYALPPAIQAHSRHYMPQGRLSGGREATSLVFDAFARIHPEHELVACWPALALPAEQRELLDDLLRDLGFLGRAESWVEARCLEEWTGEPNCQASELGVDPDTGLALDPVRVIAPVSPGEYPPWREHTISAHGLDGKKPRKRERAILATLPERFVDTLRVETADLQAAGWSSPPGARFVTYQRPSDAFTPTATTRPPSRPHPATTVRLALSGRPLPRLEDAVRIAEIARMATIKKAEHVGDGTIPPAMSGHNLPGDANHGHAFYLPEDADDDGHIDHILVHAPDGLPAQAIQALDRIRRLWDRDGRWPVLVEGYGDRDAFPDAVPFGHGRVWTSVTPYLHPWFAKKRFGVAEQIARECRQRDLPEPVRIEPVERVKVGGTPRRPVHFRRFRSTPKRLRQPDTRGQFLTLTFPEPVAGPIALGFACHFGLGLFRPVSGEPGDE